MDDIAAVSVARRRVKGLIRSSVIPRYTGSDRGSALLRYTGIIVWFRHRVWLVQVELAGTAKLNVILANLSSQDPQEPAPAAPAGEFTLTAQRPTRKLHTVNPHGRHSPPWHTILSFSHLDA